MYWGIKPKLKAVVEDCVEKTDYPNFENQVVDNNSEDPGTTTYINGNSK